MGPSSGAILCSPVCSRDRWQVGDMAGWGHTTLERFNGAGCGPGDTALLHVAGCDHPLGPSTVHHSAFVHKNKHHGKLRITRPTQKHLDTSDRVSPGISVAAESSSGRPVWPRSAALCVPGTCESEHTHPMNICTAPILDGWTESPPACSTCERRCQSASSHGNSPQTCRFSQQRRCCSQSTSVSFCGKKR
jgi:hypothetical protein